jgi:hypothetical protein
MDVTLTEKYRNDDYFQDKNAPTYVYMTGGTPGGDPFVSANYYTKTDLLTTGVLDARYYTETEIGANFYTKTQLDGGQLDTRYYTETEIDNSVVKLAGTQTITGAKTFSATATFASGSWDSSYLYASGYIKSAGRIIAGGLSSLHATAQIQGKIDTTIAWQNLLLFKDESNTVNFNIANGAGAGDFFPVFTGKVTSSLPGLYFCGNAVNGVPSGTALVAFDGRVNDAAAAASDIILGVATGYSNYKVKIYGDGSMIFDNAADLGSSTYSSGYAGSGWRVDYASPKYTLEIDNLSVRNTLTAYELAINKISSVGGSLVVSVANARSYSQAYLGGSSYRIYFDEDSTNNQIPFLAGDVVRAQNYTGRGTAEFMGSVTSVVHSATLGSAYIDVTAITDSPWNVMDLVQVGHSSTAARQNLIYITASDTNNPYIDFLAGVTDGNFSGKQKARIGNLTGITDSDFGGALSGYGVYADNVYLKGAVRASSGLIGGFTIDATEGLYAGTGATRVQMKPGAGFWSGATAFADAPFSVSPAGSLKALGVAEIGTNTGTYGSYSWNIGIKNADIFEASGLNYSILYLNRLSYQGGMSYYRDLVVGDGKGNDSLRLSQSALTFYVGNPSDATEYNLRVTGNCIFDHDMDADSVHCGNLTTDGGGVNLSSSTTINFGGNHTIVTGTSDITCGSSEADMTSMSTSFTPKGTKILIMFSAPFTVTSGSQTLTLQMNIGGSNVRKSKCNIYTNCQVIAYQHIATVTPNSSITVKMRWSGSTAILQRGSTDSERIMTIVDLQ